MAAQKQRQTVVAIGNFDGVHGGHRALIGAARQVADDAGLPLVVLTFEPHPQEVITGRPVPRLTAAAEKEQLLLEAGADDVCVIPFTPEFSQKTPAAFIDEVLVDTLNARHVLVGEDFRFGCRAAGAVATLAADARFDTTAVPLVKGQDGVPLSSRQMRQGRIQK
jgi:riboflavin kinase/FMN adenylyltransferase